MYLKDRLDIINSTPRKPSGDYKKFATQKYPVDILTFYFKNHPSSSLITKETKVVSIGSCFAENISKYLRAHKYNYLVTENGDNFSANWGIVFNSSSIRQIFEYSFGLFKPIVDWWEREEGRMQDPYRRNIIYTKGVHEQKRNAHFRASKEAIENADVIIITLGLVEVWRDKRDGAVFWRVPPMHLYNPNFYEFYVMSIEDVYNDLETIKKIIDKFNPDCKLVITVSPIPLQATYREEIDVVIANTYSKAVSTVSAINFYSKWKSKGVYYFPSFEFVRYGVKDPFTDDGRHIRKPVIDLMMKFFEKMFC